MYLAVLDDTGISTSDTAFIFITHPNPRLETISVVQDRFLHRIWEVGLGEHVTVTVFRKSNPPDVLLNV